MAAGYLFTLRISISAGYLYTTHKITFTAYLSSTAGDPMIRRSGPQAGIRG